MYVTYVVHAMLWFVCYACVIAIYDWLYVMQFMFLYALCSYIMYVIMCNNTHIRFVILISLVVCNDSAYAYEHAN